MFPYRSGRRRLAFRLRGSGFRVLWVWGVPSRGVGVGFPNRSGRRRLGLGFRVEGSGVCGAASTVVGFRAWGFLIEAVGEGLESVERHEIRR